MTFGDQSTAAYGLRGDSQSWLPGASTMRPIRTSEARLQEGDGVRRDALVLEQVAGAQDRVHALRIGQGQDAAQRLAAVRAPQPGGFGTRPGKRGVEVQIGKQQELHCPRSVAKLVTARPSRLTRADGAVEGAGSQAVLRPANRL